MQPDKTFSTAEGLLQQRKLKMPAEETVKLKSFSFFNRRVQVKHLGNVFRQMTFRRCAVFPARCWNGEY